MIGGQGERGKSYTSLQSRSRGGEEEGESLGREPQPPGSAPLCEGGFPRVEWRSRTLWAGGFGPLGRCSQGKGTISPETSPDCPHLS